MKFYEEAYTDNREDVEVIYTGFDKETMIMLPQKWESLPDKLKFVGEMLDTHTGQILPFKYSFPHYEERGQYWDDEKQDMVDCWVIQPHMITHHFCGCHRAQECNVTITSQDENEHCPQNRFLIQKFTHPNLPGVNLVYERVTKGKN